MVAQINIKQVAQVALTAIDSVLNRWCTGGKRQGHEYVTLNPTRADSKAGSFSINLNTGAWADFATGDKGGDLVSLVAYIEGVKQGEAAKQLAAFLGLNTEKNEPHNQATSPQNKAAKATPLAKYQELWTTLLPVPKDAPPPPLAHYKHGKPSLSWQYKDAAGELLCWVYRFEAKDGVKKQFLPLTYCQSENGYCDWRWQGIHENRPLYNLDRLIKYPSTLVIVTEGEKAADAAALLMPDAITTTMLNGAQSVNKTDWTPLKGRVVWLWPDNDSAGFMCMDMVAQILMNMGVSDIKQINPDAFFNEDLSGLMLKPLQGLKMNKAPAKYDAADTLADGWNEGGFFQLKDKPYFFKEVKPKTNQAKAENTDAPQTNFTINEGGVWYFDGVSEPLWICSKLEVTAFTRDAKNESWGRLLEFDDLDHAPHAWAMPMDLLKGDGAEFRGVLLSMGLQISTMQKARNLLTQYIQTAHTSNRARCVERTGWHGNVFVMPNETIGEANDERILYQSASTAPCAFKRRGKLADWQQHIAAPSAGNSRLVFAICAAFASPLLHITGMESGGLHFRGDSSTGKTTALKVAASVWGGVDYVKQWRGTDNGIETLTEQHSDCLLVLDELSQVDPKVAGEVAYMLANGSGKLRRGRTGGMASVPQWRVLFLSSGEAGLSEHMALAGKKPKAGQEVRLLDIPADAGEGYGLFNTLHQAPSGAGLSKQLNDACGKFYGVAAIEFIQKVMRHADLLPDSIKKAQREFIHKQLNGEAGGQANRAALRFGLIAAAGELATIWGITGWQSGEAHKAASVCFEAWLLNRGGAGNQEEKAMLSQVQLFFELHGESRFTAWERVDDDHAPKTVNRAGYRKRTEAKDADGNPIYTGEFYKAGDEKVLKNTDYYVFKETFISEICKGLDYKRVCRLLIDKGMLIPPEGGKGFTRSERLPDAGKSNVFRITSKVHEYEAV